MPDNSTNSDSNESFHEQIPKNTEPEDKEKYHQIHENEKISPDKNTHLNEHGTLLTGDIIKDSENHDNQIDKDHHKPYHNSSDIAKPKDSETTEVFDQNHAEGELRPSSLSEDHSNTESTVNSDTENPEVEKILPVLPDSFEVSKTSEEFYGKVKEENYKDTRSTIIPKTRESNYQISLIDENTLKLIVSSKRGVKIESIVKHENSDEETQSNEIHLYPIIENHIQEVEILIGIEEQLLNTGNNSQNILFPEPEVPTPNELKEVKKSNFQISLINENLLRIKIDTHNVVKIDSVARDKKNATQTQSNKIYLKPKSEHEPQLVEITITVDAEKPDLEIPTYDLKEQGKVKLIPNPEVVDLIQPPDYSPFFNEGLENLSDQDSIYRNPFDALRKLIRKNLTIGITAAVLIHVLAAIVIYYSLNKKNQDQAVDEQSRLIVIQDLPDPKIKLEDVEDPNKPKFEIPTQVVDTPQVKESRKEIPPRKIIKPPIVSRPKKSRDDNFDSSLAMDFTKQLDSMRKLVDKNTGKDSTSRDTAKSSYEIPDSLKNSFSEKDIGLAMYYPKSWKLTDQRDINKNEKNFTGVFITDTTAEERGTMTIFIKLDMENKDYRAEDFKTEFKMNDSTLSTFLKEPKSEGAYTFYKFYIFNKLGTEKLSIDAQVKKQFFEQYKDQIEAVVRSIRIRKKDQL